MQILLLGPPGAGKGTQASRVAAHYGLPHIAAGELIRLHARGSSALTEAVRPLVHTGNFLPTDVFVSLIKPHLLVAKEANGFVGDGLPRTLGQAEALDVILGDLKTPLHLVFFLDIPDVTIANRLRGRWTCPKCGRVYHEDSAPSAAGFRCEYDDTHLQRRSDDDDPSVVAKRSIAYNQQFNSLLRYYGNCGLARRIDADAPIDVVFRAIVGAIEQWNDSVQLCFP